MSVKHPLTTVIMKILHTAATETESRADALILSLHIAMAAAGLDEFGDEEIEVIRTGERPARTILDELVQRGAIIRKGEVLQ